MRELLLWQKYRPQTMYDIVLPERIKNNFVNGLDMNYIFHGRYGTGKTSLARILIGKYTKDKNFLEVNASLYTSIDILRNDIESFCRSTSILYSSDPMKYVFLDEFERASAQFQDAFKAFVEHYSKTVRFILTTNHYDKISDGIRSRFSSVNFTPSLEEEKLLMKEFFQKIRNITEKEDIDISDDQLASLIKKRFPDMRSVMVALQKYKMSGSIEAYSNSNDSLKIDLYRILFNKKMSYDQIYHFLMDNFGDESIDQVFQLLSRPFVEFMVEKNQSVDKLFKCNKIVAEAHSKIETKVDPIILAMTCIGEMMDVLQQP